MFGLHRAMAWRTSKLNLGDRQFVRARQPNGSVRKRFLASSTMDSMAADELPILCRAIRASDSVNGLDCSAPSTRMMNRSPPVIRPPFAI